MIGIPETLNVYQKIEIDRLIVLGLTYRKETDGQWRNMAGDHEVIITLE